MGKNREKWIKELKGPSMGRWHTLLANRMTLNRITGQHLMSAPHSGQEETCSGILGLAPQESKESASVSTTLARFLSLLPAAQPSAAQPTEAIHLSRDPWTLISVGAGAQRRGKE